MAKVDDKEYKGHGLLDQLKNKEFKISVESKPLEDILGIYQGRSCGKSAIQTALEARERYFCELAKAAENHVLPNFKPPLVEEYIRPDGTSAIRYKMPPDSLVPLLDNPTVVRFLPAKSYMLGIDPAAAEPDKLNIQVKRKHNKPKFNFNN